MIHELPPNIRLEAGCLIRRDDAGMVLSRWDPIGTRIAEARAIERRIVVCEDYYRFPMGRSNLYCLDQNLSLVWTAPIPEGATVYTGICSEEAGLLICATWECVSGWIDPHTGLIARTLFTK